jgi:hypothetical protein
LIGLSFFLLPFFSCFFSSLVDYGCLLVGEDPLTWGTAIRLSMGEDCCTWDVVARGIWIWLLGGRVMPLSVNPFTTSDCLLDSTLLGMDGFKLKCLVEKFKLSSLFVPLPTVLVVLI